MKKLWTGWLCIAALLFAGTVLRAQEGADTLLRDVAAEGGAPGAEPTPGELWDRANTAYINGDFHLAAETYRQLLDRDLVSAKLYYNLANACFKEDRLGEAVLYYRRALRLAPGSEDIRHNLSVVQAQTKDRIEEIPEFFLTVWLWALRHTMGSGAWALLSLAFLCLALGFFLAYLLARRLPLRKAGFYGTLLSAVLFLAATWCAAAARREMLDRSQAVVMPASAAVKSSPDRSATDLFLLHEGTEVEITDRLADWCEIVIGDGKKGWIESRKIEVI